MKTGISRDRREQSSTEALCVGPMAIAARRAFVERFFSNAPDFQQRLAMLDAEAIK
jgi:hypothetical protein